MYHANIIYSNVCYCNKRLEQLISLQTMTEQQYKEKIKAIKLVATKEQRAISIAYAESNNPYKIGDIISDHQYTGKIYGWRTVVNHLHTLPSLLYLCHNLTKKGTIKKREPKCKIWQINIKTNGK